MKRYAIYGKGGIGKSTLTCALSAALAQMGHRVLQIGCDPKADSTASLLGGQALTPVAEYLRTHEEPPCLEDIMLQGFGGVYCVESGGPTPGVGCAGRGILMTLHLLDELRVVERLQPDYILYDVLGDVVCGGFAAPIREHYADEVLVVTSGEKMSLFAANNIVQAVRHFSGEDYASMGGVILNRRNIPNELELVSEFVQTAQVDLLGIVPRDNHIPQYEQLNQTVIQGDPQLPVSQAILEIARKLQ